MKQKSLLTTLLLVLGLGVYTVLNTSYSSGFGTYQGNCGCHGPANTATTVAINGLPTFYNPGQAYAITVTVANSTLPFAGFQIQTNVGTLATTDADVTIQGGNMSAGHNARKAISGGVATFSLTWTAPNPGGTAANITAVGNAVNGSGTGGDAWNSAPNSNIALPVNYLNLSASQTENHISVNFETETEQNVKHFEVQRSSNASEFTTIETLEPNTTQVYSLKDYPNTKNKTFFYRIKEVSNDNKSIYSDVVSVFFTSNNTLSIYPTIVENNTIRVNGIDADQSNKYILFDAVGRTATKDELFNNQINLPNMNGGIYYLSILENNHVIKTERIVIK